MDLKSSIQNNCKFSKTSIFKLNHANYAKPTISKKIGSFIIKITYNEIRIVDNKNILV